MRGFARIFRERHLLISRRHRERCGAGEDIHKDSDRLCALTLKQNFVRALIRATCAALRSQFACDYFDWVLSFRGKKRE